MRYLNTKHEKNSAKITGLIVIILLLLLFVVGPPYLDPPPEYGVAVNFGNSNVGSGNVQPDQPVKSENLNNNKKPQETKSEPEETKPEKHIKEESSKVAAKKEEVSEKVLTQEAEAAIKIKKAKASKDKANAEAEAQRKANAKAAAEAKKKKQEADKKKLDEIMGGLNKSEGEASGSEGDDDKVGDKGQLNGNPYATSYFGDPGTGSGGVGYGLNGRGNPTKKVFKQDCNESGLVVVRIEVDRSGRVVKAEPGVKGTNNTASCLLAPAKKIALSHKWKADNKAPARQIGFVSVNFKLGQ